MRGKKSYTSTLVLSFIQSAFIENLLVVCQVQRYAMVMIFMSLHLKYGKLAYDYEFSSGEEVETQFHH